MIHTVKDFGIVNKAEIDVFLELSLLFRWSRECWQFDRVPLPFLKPAWTSGNSWFMYCWSLTWRILSITLLVCEMNIFVQQFEHSLALPFLVIGMKTDLYQSWSHFYGVYEVVILIEIENKLVVAKGWGEKVKWWFFFYLIGIEFCKD